MSKPLEVSAAEVIDTANKLADRLRDAADQARRTFAELGSAAGVSASEDQVSRAAAQAFLKAAQELPEPTAGIFGGIGKLVGDATTTAQSYLNVDQAGGGQSAIQAVTGGLGPLTQLLTTLPTQFAQAGESGGTATLTADVDDEDDDGDDGDAPAQDFTVV